MTFSLAEGKEQASVLLFGVRSLQRQIAISALHFLGYNYEAAPLHVVHTGGKRNEIISELGRHTCIIQGQSLYILVEVIKLFLSISLKKLIEFKHLVRLFVDL